MTTILELADEYAKEYAKEYTKEYFIGRPEEIDNRIRQRSLQT